MIDTHCHLSDLKFDGKIEQVLTNAFNEGVEKIIIPSVSLDDFEKANKLCDGIKTFCLCGIHPEEIDSYNNESIKFIEQQLRREEVVGVGECGLDYYWDREKKTRTKQIEALEAQIDLAIRMDVPVVLHNRESSEDMFKIVSSFEKLKKVQFHCFDGSEELLSLGLERGFYFSFCGNITYKSAENLRSVCRQVPLSQLLLETDSPYLSPEGKRGQMNEPANVRILAEALCLIKEVSFKELTEATTKNAMRLFFDK